tara:strand:+ start:9431 stop:9730 length:300 start_codon:yes stop_codon:yes gene_type:complete
MGRYNKLIAEFAGLKIVGEKEWMKAHGSPKMYTVAKEEDLKYDHCWNWLMPVLQKILDISFDDNGDAEDFYQIRDCIPDIDHTYKAIIEFITEYNKNNV